MDLSPVKYEILEAMLLLGKPARAAHIAKEAGKEFPSAMMHIIGLNRMGYTTSPEKGLYALTEKGKKALGLPEISRENAKMLLASVPQDKAFHFYVGIGEPLNLHACSIRDFCDNILKATTDSIEFHVGRGDFEAWFAGIGDRELAKETALLKKKKIDSEELRRRLHDIVEKRCTVLTNVAEHPFSA